MSGFPFDHRPSLNTQTHKAFVSLNVLSYTRSSHVHTLSSLTEHKHPPLTHSHNESQPCASQVKGAPGELWASEQPSCSKAPGGHLEEWLLYEGEIMGKKCSTQMNWSWSSLSFNNRLVCLSSHFPKKMPHQPIFMLQIIAYFSLLFPPFANSTQSCLVLERFSRYQEGRLS